MARTVIVDGRRLSVPDDATMDEIDALTRPAATPAPAQRQQPYATQQAIRQQAQMNPVERFAMGVARPVLETGYGIKEAMGGTLTPEQRHKLDVLRANEGAAGTAGRITGEVASLAAPAAGVLKVAGKAPAAVRGLTAILGETGLGAAYEGLKSPGEGETRGGNAAWGAGAAALGGAIGGVAAPFVRGVKNVTDDAAEFMRRNPNVVPTLGQMKGGVVRNLEERAKVLPFIGEQIKRRERDALNQWNKNLAERALPPGTPEETLVALRNAKPGQESVAIVQDAFGKAYDDVFPAKVDLSGDANPTAFISAIETRQLPTDAADRATKRLTDISSNFEAGPVSGTYAARVDDNLRDWATKARQNGFSDEAEVYDAARKAFRDGLPEGVSGRLRELDNAYRQWVPVETASGYKGAAAKEGVITADQLLSAARASSSSVRKRNFAAGQAAGQQEAQNVARVLGNQYPDPGPATAEKLLGVAAFLNPATAVPFAPGLVPYSRPGAKALAGKYGWQQKAKSLTEILGQGGVTAGTAGAAIEE